MKQYIYIIFKCEYKTSNKHMHYLELIEAHKMFYESGYHKAYNYDEYLENKEWGEWEKPDIPREEVVKLFRFIKSWDCFFQGDIDKFLRIYSEIFPVLLEFKDLKVEDINLDDKELTTKVRDIFDKVAYCPRARASKILHTILPDFFVMWDDKIKIGLVSGRKMGATYAFYFLKITQNAINEAIETCMDERELSRPEAIRHIRDACDGKALPKLVDEYHFLKYTKGYRDFQ